MAIRWRASIVFRGMHRGKTRCPVSATFSVSRITSGGASRRPSARRDPRARHRRALRERRRVGADLTLADERALRVERILDRVFDRDDVTPTREIDLLDQRRQRRRFTRARRTTDENEPVLVTIIRGDPAAVEGLDVGVVSASKRMAKPMPWLVWRTLMRQRTPPSGREKSSELRSASCGHDASPMRAFAAA